LEKEATAKAVVDNLPVKPLLSADDVDTWRLPEPEEDGEIGAGQELAFRCVGSEAAMVAMLDVKSCIEAGSGRGAVKDMRLIDDILGEDSDMRLNKLSRKKV
jgi:hypothetical protein